MRRAHRGRAARLGEIEGGLRKEEKEAAGISCWWEQQPQTRPLMVSWRHALASVALVFLLLADGTDARVKAGVMAEEKRRRSLSSSGSSNKKTGDQEPSLSETPEIVQWGYKNERGVKFHPAQSSTFRKVWEGHKVELNFLDNTELSGYDGQDFVTVGGIRTETRLGMITFCNSRNFNHVDGIIGFGFDNDNRSASILKTMSQSERPAWHITQPPPFKPMPRRFCFTADENGGELQLGGYDPSAIDGEMDVFPMLGPAYGANVTSITYAGHEILQWNDDWDPDFPPHTPSDIKMMAKYKGYLADFDSGTTCMLLPNSTNDGQFKRSPFMNLLDLEMSGLQAPLVFTIGGKQYEIPFDQCVEPAGSDMILGDPWFRLFVVMHDLSDLENPMMGLGKRKTEYKLAVSGSISTSKLVEHGEAGGAAGGWVVQRVPATRMPVIEEAVGAQSLVAHDGKAVPASAVESRDLVSKVKLDGSSHVTYWIDVEVGTPPQKLKLIFDTGSYVLGVFSDKAPSPALSVAHAAVQTLLEMTGNARREELGWLMGSNIALASAGFCVAVVVAGVLYVSRRARFSSGANVYSHLDQQHAV